MLVSSMRKTVVKANGNSNYAQSMYEDMMYDEYTNALGIANVNLKDKFDLMLEKLNSQRYEAIESISK